jgi:hypothetical protein
MMDKPHTLSVDDKLLNDDFVQTPTRRALSRSKTAKLMRILLILGALVVVLRLVFWFVTGR